LFQNKSRNFCLYVDYFRVRYPEIMRKILLVGSEIKPLINTALEEIKDKYPDSKANELELLVVDTEQKSNRQKALEWWSKYNPKEQAELANFLVDKFPLLDGRSINSLTGSEIQKIWECEVGNNG
jgi:hypothetical protein